MSCVLTIAEKNINGDDVVAESGLPGFFKRDNRKVANSISDPGKNFSFVSAIVTEGELDYFEKQVPDAIEYLHQNQNKLAFIAKSEGIELCYERLYCGFKICLRKVLCRKFMIVIAVLVNIMSCKLDGADVVIIDAKGLNEDNLSLNSMTFIDKDTGFIAGNSDVVTHNPDFPENDSNQFAFVKRNALIFKTTDGGKTWAKSEMGNGSLREITVIGSTIFAYKTSEDRSQISISFSSDLGNTWKEIASSPKGIYQIVSVDNHLYGIATDSVKSVTYIHKSDDQGKEWSNAYKLLYNPFNVPIQFKEKIVYLSNTANAGYYPDIIVWYDPRDSSNNVVSLPKDFNCYFLSASNFQIKLVGVKDGYIKVYAVQKDNGIKYEYSYKNIGFFPQGYYHGENEDWIIAGKRNYADISNGILRTIDNGREWEVIGFKNEKIIKPFCFLNDNSKTIAWFYAGSGKFQVVQ